MRDRIKELRRVPAAELRPHPRNWRVHPDRQRRALAHVLDRVGYADALLVRELAEGGYQIIDGHLRAETTPEATLPVLVLDVTESEAELLLATCDPLAGMAEVDGPVLAELLAEVDVTQADLDAELAALAGETELPVLETELDECPIPEAHQVLVECDDESAQRELFERLSEEGWRCRVLTL
jgi:ParB-like chromosome segregation protein Spo0J